MTPSTIGVRLTAAFEVHFHVIEHGVVLPAYGTDTQRPWSFLGFLTALGVGALTRRSL